MSNGRDPAQVQVQAQEATRTTTTTTKHNIGIELMKAAGAEIPTAGTLDKPPETSLPPPPPPLHVVCVPCQRVIQTKQTHVCAHLCA